MKQLYRFSITKDNFVEEPVLKKDDSGAEIKVLEKVNRPITKNYFVAKPTFSIKQESNLYFESVVAECIKRGIHTTIQLRKHFINNGGILTEQEKKDYDTLWAKLWDKKAELNKLNENPETNADTVKVANDEIIGILGNLGTIEQKSGSAQLYEHTAEKIASDRTVLWLATHLTYQDLGNNKVQPVFTGVSDEEKFNKYEELQDDPDYKEIIEKSYFSANLWFFGKAEKQEDFDNIFKIADNQKVFDQK